MSPNLYGVLTVALVSIAPMVNVTALKSPNQQLGGRFGESVSDAGDVDRDGFADVIVGAPGERNLAGRAYVFSGKGAALLFQLGSPDPDALDSFGSSVSDAGDVNQDGFADVIVGSPREEAFTVGGRAYVFSGAEGRLLFSLVSPAQPGGFFGWSVAAAGDVDRDGHPDVIVGDNLAERAYVISGDDGSMLLELMSPNEQHFGFFGHSVASAGDLDDDGSPDLIVGAWQEHTGGRAYAFSGRDGSLLFELESPNQQAAGGFGYSVSGLGDVSGDGTPDLAVGAIGETVDNLVSAGRAYAFSGRDGSLLFEFTPPQPKKSGMFGHSVSGLGDLNGDALAEIVVGEPSFPRELATLKDGRAFVFNGQDGRMLLELRSPRQTGPHGLFGLSVSGAGDVDQDGSPDVIVGAPNEGADRTGRAYIFSSLQSP